MPKNASDEAGFHSGKRSGKADPQLPARDKADGNDSAGGDADDYVHMTLKKGGEKFWILAHRIAAQRLKAGEDILLSDVVENSDVYFGKQGQPNRASKAMLSGAFGDLENDVIIRQIINEGSVM